MSAPIRIFDEDRFSAYQKEYGAWAIWDWEESRDRCVLSGMRDDEKLCRKFTEWMNKDEKK
jgi:hypothetical protein